MAQRSDAGQVKPVSNDAFKAHLVDFSRRFSSRSTASRTRSVLSSPSVKTALMRAKVPSANRACISSAHRFFLPTRGGVADMTFESQAVRFRISVIAPVSHISYPDNSYDLWGQCRLLYYVSRTGTKRNRGLIKACGWRWMVGPLDMGGPVKDDLNHACDNGAWPCYQLWLKGKRATADPDLRRFQACIARHGATADFIIVPDVVMGGDRSWAMTRYWLRRLRRDRRFTGVKLLIAVQNGMTAEMIKPYLNERVGVFVGGDTDWKLATMKMWCDLAHENGAVCHVGRVNTDKRMVAIGKAGADSGDGSSGARYAVTILPLERSRREVVLRRSQLDIEDYLARAA